MIGGDQNNVKEDKEDGNLVKHDLLMKIIRTQDKL